MSQVKVHNKPKKHLGLLLAALVLNSCGTQTAEAPATVKGWRAEVFNAKTMGGMLDPVSKAFLLVGEQGSILRSKDGYDWEYAATPTERRLHNIAGDARSGILIAVGDAGTVLRSEDAGHTWLPVRIETPEGVDLAQTELREVIHHSVKDVWLAAGTHNAVLRSADQGRSWRLVSYDNSPQRLEILALFIEPASGDFLLAAQGGTMGRSSDGADWTITYHDMQPAGSYVPHLVDFYQYGEALIAAGDEGRLLVSHDHGANWKLFRLPTTGYFTGGAYDPVHRSIVLTTEQGDDIAYSRDAGRSWELTRLKVAGWPNDDIPMLSAIVYDAATHSLLAMGSSGVVARSADGGRSWRAGLLQPLFNLSLTTLLHDPERDLFVASGLGGFIAVARGLLPDPEVGWRIVRPGIDDLQMREVINLPGTDTFVIVGQYGGIWRSGDDGRNWDFIQARYPYPNQPPYLRDIIVDPSTQALVAAGPDGSIMRSTDAGLNWKPAFQGVITLGEAFTQILADSGRNTLLALDATYQAVYLSKDGGAAWQKLSTVPTGGRKVWRGAISEKLGAIMVVGEGGAIGISGDGGQSWETPAATSENLYGAFTDEKTGALFAVGDWGMLLRSEDGRQWQIIDTGTRSTLRRMFADPRSGALLAFGQDGVILRSIDGGRSWRKAPAPALDSELRKALSAPGSGHLVIVGSDGTILLSSDSGASWGRVPGHTAQHFRSAAFNPATGTMIAVGDGLVRLSRMEEKKN